VVPSFLFAVPTHTSLTLLLVLAQPKPQVLARPEYVGAPRTSGRIPTRLPDALLDDGATFVFLVPSCIAPSYSRGWGHTTSTGASKAEPSSPSSSSPARLRRHLLDTHGEPLDLLLTVKIRTLDETVRSDLNRQIQI
jgi:hypothetical protein